MGWWEDLEGMIRMSDAWNMGRPDLPGSSEEWRDLRGLTGAGDRPVGPLPLLLTEQPRELPNPYDELLRFRPPTHDTEKLPDLLEGFLKRRRMSPVL